jgi:hypothetical protein
MANTDQRVTVSQSEALRSVLIGGVCLGDPQLLDFGVRLFQRWRTGGGFCEA